MPRQNRVLPTAEIVAAPFRGTLMGNRGILHDEAGRLGRARWRHRAWIACRLHFKDRHRAIMAPRRYTELFFFDEAVALAAGHRPCAECRRADYNRFLAAWSEAHSEGRPSAQDLDRILHDARLDPVTRRQRTFTERFGALPDGVFVTCPGQGPSLLHGGCLHAYRGDRYGPAMLCDRATSVTVLTPAPIVRAIRAGYRPAVQLTSL